VGELLCGHFLPERWRDQPPTRAASATLKEIVGESSSYPFVRALFKNAVSLTACAGRYWSSDSASTTGAALAFFCAFSLAPLLVILLTVAGLVVGAKAAYGQVGTQLNSLFGASTATILLDAVQKAEQPQGLVATLISVVTLLIGATTVLAALEAALEQIWKSAAIVPPGVRGWLRTRFLSLGFILTLGFCC
jgi:membrane protein